jgi:hypothetical protein
MLPQSYVVRIYRRDPDRPDRIDGILIAADTQSRHAFHSEAELLRLLASVAAKPVPGDRIP